MSEERPNESTTGRPVVAPDEFYVGYLPKAPSGVAGVVRRVVVGLWVLSVLVAVVGAAMQRSPGTAVWGDAVVTKAGMLVVKPYPMLLVGADDGSVRTVLLVNPGKCGLVPSGDFCGPREGAEEALRTLSKLDHQMVQVRGTVLERDGREMVELADGLSSVKEAVGEQWRGFPRGGTGPVWKGHFNVRGTIVDSKCYMGAMKPGEGKVHRDCAVRCVLGGVPPVLVTRDANGAAAYYLLTDSRGEVDKETWASLADDRVDVDGELDMIGDIGILAVNRVRCVDGTRQE